MTMQDEQGTESQGPFTKVFGLVGFGIGMILMIAFIPISRDHSVNAFVGAVVGSVSSFLGTWIGSFLDQLHSRL